MPPAKKAAPAAKKSAAPVKAAAQVTVTLKHLAAALSDSHDLPKRQAEAVLGDLVTLTTRHLKKGDKIRLNGLGILQVRKRAARMGRNPATGEAIPSRRFWWFWLAGLHLRFDPPHPRDNGVKLPSDRLPCLDRA